MTPEERRALVEKPVESFRRLLSKPIGGKSHAGYCRITDAEADTVQRRYLRWLERRQQADRYEA